MPPREAVQLPALLLHAQYLALADRHTRQHALYQSNDPGFSSAWKLFAQVSEEVHQTIRDTIAEIDRNTPTVMLAILRRDLSQTMHPLYEVDPYVVCQNAATRAVSGVVSLLTQYRYDQDCLARRS